MKRTILNALMALLLVLGCRSALAWNSIGHMSVAWVAYQRLTPVEKARVARLLQRNPYYRVWLKMIPAGNTIADRDTYLFMMAATWPDEIKAVTSHYTGTDTPPPGEKASLNDGYKAMKAHKYWHFMDTPLGSASAGPPPEPLPGPNVEQKIGVLRADLASKESASLKSYDLVWLIHLVGDAHQPLHCVSRISAAQPKGDRGGNLVLINDPSKELHAFWDGLLGAGQTKDFLHAVEVARTLPDPDPSLASKDNQQDWVAESYALAGSAVYTDPIGPGPGPFTLNETYTANAKEIAKQRVALAGARLANLIKTAFQCNEKSCAH